jgi:FixJ family two-component response regulator
MSAVIRVCRQENNALTENNKIFNTVGNMTAEPCVFIVDDDEAIRDGIELVIDTLGLACRTFDSAEKFLGANCHDQGGCLLLDFSLPGLNGLELQAELSNRNVQLPIIFLTAHGNALLEARAIKAGAFGFLTKPVQIELLIENIQSALKKEA